MFIITARETRRALFSQFSEFEQKLRKIQQQLIFICIFPATITKEKRGEAGIAENRPVLYNE